MVKERADLRKRILLSVMIVLSPFLVIAATCAFMLYQLDSAIISIPFRSPNGKYTASVAHYFGDGSNIRMETSGIHPFNIGTDDVYGYVVEEGWVSRLTWRDNHTLIVTFCFHQPPPSLPKCRWRDVDILFQQDNTGAPT